MMSTIISAARVLTAIDAHNITIGTNIFTLQFKKKTYKDKKNKKTRIDNFPFIYLRLNHKSI